MTNATSAREKLEKLWAQGHFVCVGLDPEYSKIPKILKRGNPIEDRIFEFNRSIIEATGDLVCAFKPNSAFYEVQGTPGWNALAKTIRYIKTHYPDIPVILDAKRGDINYTNMFYAKAVFEELRADAITLHPYLGGEALKPFLDRTDKLTFVLVKTSNAGAGEFQDLSIGKTHEPLYMTIARHVIKTWNKNGNCGIVVGATYTQELAEVRKIVGDIPILIPGIGTQGGDVKSTVKAGRDSRGWGMIINSSRGIIFASREANYQTAARDATRKLNKEVADCIASSIHPKR